MISTFDKRTKQVEKLQRSSMAVNNTNMKVSRKKSYDDSKFG